MKKNAKRLVLPGVLLFYSFLYIATAKSPKCDDVCQKMNKVRVRLEADSTIYGTHHCRTNILCLYVNDAATRDWTSVADTVCGYLNNEGLHNYTIAVVGSSGNRDTLLKQSCP